MQQTFFCPNCKSQVAYGQAYCTRCNTALIWPGLQTPAQSQSTQNQYPNQQQSWGQQYQYGQQYGPNQQQWNQQQQPDQSSSANQTATSGKQVRKKTKQSDDGPGLLEQIQEHKGAIAKIVVALVVITVLIGVFTSLQGEIAKVFSKPVVQSFDTTAAEIITGQSATLKWNVTGVSSVSITPGIGTVSSSGTRTVSPDKTTNYALIANNMFGSANGAITVTVREPSPTVESFSFDRDSIIAGQPATLSWSVSNATMVTISPEIGVVSLTGSKSLSPNSSTTYTLTASNSAGNSTSTATVTVASSGAPVINTFSASPTSIKAGESATLAWDVSGSTSININQGIGGVGAKDSRQISPTATATYTLTAGSETRSVTVTVDTSNVKSTATSTIPTSAPTITTFSASHKDIMLGENTTLSWVVTGAKSVTINPDVGTFQPSDSVFLIPLETTTYTLLASNNLGTENATVTVSVTPDSEGTPPEIQLFTASPSTISAGGTSTLAWSILGATSISINQGIGTPESRLRQEVQPTVTTTYVLTAVNKSGLDSATVVVTVEP
ncbi:MAG: hypothetical protein EHM12_02260 [Dehalococcoidia bacterium]|nr:MAG: hypothetical protein EHM12_02260 [Dehalococcoidia bacterium]